MSKGESGQAIAEMTIALVGIMVVFLGVIFAFAIGKANIETLLDCRGEADSYAANDVGTTAGLPIKTWGPGGDERMYTNDDEPIVGTNDNPELFQGELKSENVDLVGGFSKPYIRRNFAADMANDSMIFLRMANLTSYDKSVDPVAEANIEELREGFQSLIYSPDIVVRNAVFMPIFGSADATPQPPSGP